MSKGWKGEGQRHGLASRGIKTKLYAKGDLSLKTTEDHLWYLKRLENIIRNDPQNRDQAIKELKQYKMKMGLVAFGIHEMKNEIYINIEDVFETIKPGRTIQLDDDDKTIITLISHEAESDPVDPVTSYVWKFEAPQHWVEVTAFEADEDMNQQIFEPNRVYVDIIQKDD